MRTHYFGISCISQDMTSAILQEKNCEKGSLILSPNVDIRGAAAFKVETQTKENIVKKSS